VTTTYAKARGEVPFTMVDLLLRGYPGELLPDDLRRAEAAAQWFIADPKQPESARARVLTVWVERTYAPAWDPKRDGSGTQKGR
jgi:hypothetical protein